MALRLSTGLRNRLLGINTEKITNGAFTSDATSWTASNATLSSSGSGQSGNCLRITETGGASPGQAYQDITTKIGHLYKLSLYFKQGTAASGLYKVGTTSVPGSIYTSAALSDATWTQYTTYFVATATTTRITLESTDATVGEYSEFDTVTCQSLSRSVQDIFNGGELKIYTGTQPSAATDAPTGTLLVTINNGGSGVTFDDAASGTISKKSTETWSGVCVATGTAGWFRLQTAGDGAGSSTTDERIDGAIATSGSQLNMTSTSFASGATETITTFTLSIAAG